MLISKLFFIERSIWSVSDSEVSPKEQFLVAGVLNKTSFETGRNSTLGAKWSASSMRPHVAIKPSCPFSSAQSVTPPAQDRRSKDLQIGHSTGRHFQYWPRRLKTIMLTCLNWLLWNHIGTMLASSAPLSLVPHLDKISAETPVFVPLDRALSLSVQSPSSTKAGFTFPADLTITPELESPLVAVSPFSAVARRLLVLEPKVLKMRVSLHPTSCCQAETFPISTAQELPPPLE